MTLKVKSEFDHPLRRHPQTAKPRPKGDPGNNCGRAAAKPPADRNFVFDPDGNAVQWPTPTRKRFLGCSDEEIVAVDRNLFTAEPAPLNCRVLRFSSCDLEMQIECQR
jgi:hypothetical protein